VDAEVANRPSYARVFGYIRREDIEVMIGDREFAEEFKKKIPRGRSDKNAVPASILNHRCTPNTHTPTVRAQRNR
jgi:hypothetical protein